MFSLLKYAKKYKIQIVLGPFFKFMEAIFELFLPIYMADLINNGIQNKNESYTIRTALLMFIMTVVGLICVMICQYFASIASQGFGTELRRQLLHKINTFSHKELDYYGNSTLVTRITNDINQLQLALAMLIRLVIRAPFLSIGSVIMAFYINSRLALVFIISLPLFCLLLLLIMKKTVPLYISVQQKIDQLNQAITENLTGVRVIRAFARQNRQIKKVDSISDSLARSYNCVGTISALLNPATTFILNMSIISLLYFGGIDINTGTLQQGDVLALINYMIQMLFALIVVSNLVVIFTRASASASRVNEILQTKPVIFESNDSIQNIDPLPETKEMVSFRNVSFKYTEKSGLALEDICFSVKSGTTLGIIGPTGSGKSTLINLLPRFYDVTVGDILVAETATQHISLATLRKNIGIVPQTSILFSGTIRENLQWGHPNATDEECWLALDIAQCKDFVAKLPSQLDTRVDANGKNFSGGQRQRLCIARAIIRNPKILILDDSLSALDYQTDLLLRTALKEKMENTTILIVSQRVSSIQTADKIVVLDNGKQEGVGTHSYLLKNSIVYRNIFLSQQEGVERNHEL